MAKKKSIDMKKCSAASESKTVHSNIKANAVISVAYSILHCGEIKSSEKSMTVINNHLNSLKMACGRGYFDFHLANGLFHFSSFG